MTPSSIANFRPTFDRIALSFGCIAFALALESSICAQTTPTLDRVIAAPPLVKTLSLTTTQPGRITAYEETPLTSKLSGYVESVLVDIGTEVAKDQVLIRLSIPEMNDELVQQEAMVAQALAEVGQAKSTLQAVQAAAGTAEAGIQEVAAGKGRVLADLDRIKAEAARIQQLAKTGSVTTKLVDETMSQLKASEAGVAEVEARVRSAEATYKQAKSMIDKSTADVYAFEAKVNVAKANLARLRTMMTYREIKAPYAGVITQRNIDTGSFVQTPSSQSQPLLTIARTDMIRVRVDIPEMEAGYIDAGPENGDEATITIQSLGKPPIKTKIVRSSWSLDASNRSLRTEMDVNNAERLYRPGVYANVSILLDKRPDVVVLPLTAVYKKETGPYCCVVVDGKIAHRPIELGLRSGSEIEIRSGVSASDTVVTIRGENLTDGQQVAVVGK